MATVREEGYYSIDEPVHGFVSFVLSLAFGGAVGPEAGLTGFIAAGCTKIGEAMSAARAQAFGIVSTLSKLQKILVYGIGIVGGILGVALYCSMFGGMGLPRFTVPEFSFEAVILLIPLTCAGLALSALMRLCTYVFRMIAVRFRGNEIAKAGACGLALGVAVLALPYVLFPGTEQLSGLITDAASIGAAELTATSIAKMLLLTLCLSMGWSGGPFFH